jgi:hypothetical protein
MTVLRPLSLALAAVLLVASVSVMPADHAESPGADADPAADLADVFVFGAPGDAGKLVGAITFGGRAAPRARIDGSFYCDRNVLYSYFIDRANAVGAFDDAPDIRVDVRFGLDSRGNCGVRFDNVPGAGGPFSGATEQVLTTSSGIRGFAGLRNDPFFFDAEGLTALLDTFATDGQNGDLVSAFGLGQRERRDSFASRNVSAIVFEMDLNVVAPNAQGSAVGVRPKIRVWATTGRVAG